MSYLFSAVSDRLVGTITTALDDDTTDITMAAWVRFTTSGHPAAQRQVIMLASEPTPFGENIVSICTSSTLNNWQVRADAVALSAITMTKAVTNETWYPFIGIHSLTARSGYFDDQTASSTVDVDLALLDNMSIGNVPNSGTASFPGWIAEVAVWNIALTAPQIAQYQSGISASIIQPANLRMYFPLLVDVGEPIPNEGLDAAADMNIFGLPAWSAIHPTITLGGTSAAVIQHYRRNVRNSANV